MTYQKDGKNYTVKFLDVDDKRCTLDPLIFSVFPYKGANASLEISELKGESSLVEKKIVQLLDSQCGDSFTREEQLDALKKEDEYVQEVLGLKIRLLTLDPYPTFDSNNSILTESKEKYKATIILE
ncbi:MAG: hypothetical protein ACRCVT_03555 [Leadbetterella sp.]